MPFPICRGLFGEGMTELDVNSKGNTINSGDLKNMAQGSEIILKQTHVCQ